ncbi:unnamed protein product [Durusdinium trenchii]|uniref:Uncharacterized protein n=1 Tax=Durusdinium trenchii TaxID=1381693 RepID=A0ABP0L7U0_9DINO
MQQLFVENATLRESLLSFSSSLTQASSIVKASADVEGDKALQQILSSIRANAECAVPAVFTRLNASRKLDPRLEQEARERRENLMKSLIWHLSEEPHEEAFAATAPARWNTAPELPRQPRTLVKHRSSMEDLEERQPQLPNRQSRPLKKQPPAEALEDLPCVARGQDAFDLNARSSWSRQCSGASQVSNTSSRMSSRRQSFLGITSLEFRHDAGKVKPLRPTPATVRRAPEPAGPGPGLMLPHVPIQARGNSDSEHLSPGTSDLRASSESSSDGEFQKSEERPHMPKLTMRPPQDSQSGSQTQR